ncbi:MAG TPA: SDR family NAD(P)-dependent oxidoreductase [Thermoleophilaceae bacterium]|nr:SDR family NAD(P)-dependent oxidoreductase [Thermoleophilaceae bacterium]
MAECYVPVALGSVPGMQLQDANVLLTGASGGIGRAIARALDARGAKVLLSARRADVLEEIRAELGGRPGTLPADLADRAAAAELVAQAGEVDVLVANAGLPASGRAEGFSAEEIDAALDVNLRAPIQLTRLLLPGMLERGRGHLLYVSSLAGKVASPRGALYSATKFGLRGYAAGLRQDVEPRGVGVTVVYPGFISDAGMFADSGAKLPPWVGTRTPQQLAEAVVQAIEQDRAEVDVAPLSLRAGSLLASLAPVTLARVQRRLGSVGVADSIAQGQRPES